MRKIKIDARPRKNAWAPGDYRNTCLNCGDEFMGDKRAVTCADCAYASSRRERFLPIRQDSCDWTDNQDGTFSTECEHTWTFEDDPQPFVRFCQGCGGVVNFEANAKAEAPPRQEPTNETEK